MSSALPPESSSIQTQTTNYTNHMIESIFSYKGNIMLAAVISLLLVILFVLLLHVYANWFLERSRNRRRRRATRRISSLILSDNTSSHVDFNAANRSNVFAVDTTSSKGMDPSGIALIPLFVFEAGKDEDGLECVVCLSSFEEREVGRRLPKCGHAFHVECIDTWLVSHVNCPICRMPVTCDKKVEENITCLEDPVATDEVSELPEIEAGLGDLEDSSLEIVTVDDVQECVDENATGSTNGDSISSSSSNSSLGCSYSYSLKRMLSKSRSERKVHPNLSEAGSLN